MIQLSIQFRINMILIFVISATSDLIIYILENVKIERSYLNFQYSIDIKRT